MSGLFRRHAWHLPGVENEECALIARCLTPRRIGLAGGSALTASSAGGEAPRARHWAKMRDQAWCTHTTLRVGAWPKFGERALGARRFSWVVPLPMVKPLAPLLATIATVAALPPARQALVPGEDDASPFHQIGPSNQIARAPIRVGRKAASAAADPVAASTRESVHAVDERPELIGVPPQEGGTSSFAAYLGSTFAATEPLIGPSMRYTWSDTAHTRLKKAACAPLAATVDRHTIWFKGAVNDRKVVNRAHRKARRLHGTASSSIEAAALTVSNQQEAERAFVDKITHSLCANPNQGEDEYTQMCANTATPSCPACCSAQPLIRCPAHVVSRPPTDFTLCSVKFAFTSTGTFTAPSG